MDNPPRNKNCHFLDLIEDEVGPCGITVNPDKEFDDEAQWQYLEGFLEEKTDAETAAHVKFAHQKLPELFKRVNTNTSITYPF